MKTFKELFENKEEWLGTDKSDYGANYREVESKLNIKHNLTLDEHNSLANYKQSTHLITNKKLRSGSDFVSNSMKNLDRALNNHKIKENVHVWRGTGNHKFPELNKNDVFHDKGYISTSLSPDHAAGFFGGNKELLHIKVPKGSKGLVMNNVLGEYSPEHEVLLPRGSKFKYHGHTTEDGFKVHHLTHIPESENNE